MGSQALLERLERARQNGAGRWLACCPAHADRSPSLSIRELDDGRVLLHCFAGCRVDEIVAAVGIQLHDLFPPRPVSHHVSRERRRFDAADVLAALADEAQLVAIAAANIAQGVQLTQNDRARLITAAARINGAVELALGRR